MPGKQHEVGAAHALEIRCKFNLVQPAAQRGGNAPGGMMEVQGPESVKTAHNMSQTWSSFARTGCPSAKGQPSWLAYTTAKRSTMEINALCRVVDDPYSLDRRMWERFKVLPAAGVEPYFAAGVDWADGRAAGRGVCAAALQCTTSAPRTMGSTLVGMGYTSLVQISIDSEDSREDSASPMS